MKKVVYECDSCGVQVKDPHTLHMKEFILVDRLDRTIGWYRAPGKVRRKIHLCDLCFNNLHKIAEKKDQNSKGDI